MSQSVWHSDSAIIHSSVLFFCYLNLFLFIPLIFAVVVSCFIWGYYLVRINIFLIIFFVLLFISLLLLLLCCFTIVSHCIHPRLVYPWMRVSSSVFGPSVADGMVYRQPHYILNFLVCSGPLVFFFLYRDRQPWNATFVSQIIHTSSRGMTCVAREEHQTLFVVI